MLTRQERYLGVSLISCFTSSPGGVHAGGIAGFARPALTGTVTLRLGSVFGPNIMGNTLKHTLAFFKRHLSQARVVRRLIALSSLSLEATLGDFFSSLERMSKSCVRLNGRLDYFLDG